MNDEIAARRADDREMPVVCNVVVRDALHGAWRDNSARLEADLDF